jgi:hypothetical protein
VRTSARSTHQRTGSHAATPGRTLDILHTRQRRQGYPSAHHSAITPPPPAASLRSAPASRAYASLRNALVGRVSQQLDCTAKGCGPLRRATQAHTAWRQLSPPSSSTEQHKRFQQGQRRPHDNGNNHMAARPITRRLARSAQASSAHECGNRASTQSAAPVNAARPSQHPATPGRHSPPLRRKRPAAARHRGGPAPSAATATNTGNHSLRGRAPTPRPSPCGQHGVLRT